jgi:transcriptional regulator with XRE-family HTH domain
MVNKEDFTKRLGIILEYYSLHASAFADKIGVQRSSLSHLLSGRNKPSLDLILKILDVFPEVDLYWILNGKGTFPKSDFKEGSRIGAYISTPTNENPIIETLAEKRNKVLTEDLFNQKNIPEEKSTTNVVDLQNLKFQKSSSEIDQIVIFYKNGTFKTFSPE